MTSHNETYYTGDTSRALYDAMSTEGRDIVASVQAAFPWAKADGAFAVSTSIEHEILAEPVITFMLSHPVTELLVGAGVPLSSRKFCMTSKTSFIRAYKVWTGSNPAYLPSGCTPMFKGENLEEYSRSAPSSISTFEDCYFKGDPATVESHFNLPERRGTHDTFYGVTAIDEVVSRVKQYTYNANTRFSNWDVLHLLFTKMLANP